jgi:nucleoside-diphosphate-sugar epimerase
VKDIVVTGGGGFLGAHLISALLAAKADRRSGLPEFDRIVSLDLAPCPVQDARVVSLQGDLSDPARLEQAVGPDTVALFHLAAVVSGQAEAEFDTGMAVNLDGTRALLDACRQRADRPFLFFASSLAVFGADCPETVGEDQVLRPRSSYGTQKAIGELLVADYDRKGFLRGVVGRLPTVVIRPGRPNAAASSFASSILREPLAGAAATCTVPEDLPLWISSPDAVVDNIVGTVCLDHARLQGQVTLNLPGITVTPREMIDALARAAGPETAARVTVAPDPRIEAIVASWPGRFDVTRALGLGFRRDAGIDDIIAAHRRALAA